MSSITPPELEKARYLVNQQLKKPYDTVVTQDMRQEDGVQRSMSLLDYAEKGIGTGFKDVADLIRQYYTSAPSRRGIKNWTDSQKVGVAPDTARGHIRKIREISRDEATATLGMEDTAGRFDNWMIAIHKLAREETRVEDIDETTFAGLQRGKELLQAIVKHSKREQERLEGVKFNPPDTTQDHINMFQQALAQQKPRKKKDEISAPEAPRTEHLHANAHAYLREKLYGEFAQQFLDMTTKVMEVLRVTSLPEPKLPGGITG